MVRWWSRWWSAGGAFDFFCRARFWRWGSRVVVIVGTRETPALASRARSPRSSRLAALLLGAQTARHARQPVRAVGHQHGQRAAAYGRLRQRRRESRQLGHLVDEVGRQARRDGRERRAPHLDEAADRVAPRDRQQPRQHAHARVRRDGGLDGQLDHAMPRVTDADDRCAHAVVDGAAAGCGASSRARSGRKGGALARANDGGALQVTAVVARSPSPLGERARRDGDHAARACAPGGKGGSLARRDRDDRMGRRTVTDDLASR